MCKGENCFILRVNSVYFSDAPLSSFHPGGEKWHSTSIPPSDPTSIHLLSPNTNPPQPSSLFPHQCYGFLANLASRRLHLPLSPVSESPLLELTPTKPFPSQVSRTILELSSHGTFSTFTLDCWPLGVGVRFAVDPDGTPVLCLNDAQGHFSSYRGSALHVQLGQSGLRTPQCTILGSLGKPEDAVLFRRLRSVWTKRFGLLVEEDELFYIDVERVLLMEDFGEVGTWVNSSDYRSASPDPLRDCAERIVDEINSNNVEDIHRFCSVYVDLDFQVSEAKMIWVDRLGFDVRIYSPSQGRFDVRIPFPREVTDEKGAKSSFNCMSQLAWEVEKTFHVPDFQKVEQLKHIA